MISSYLVNLMDLPHYLGPARGGDALQVVLNHPENQGIERAAAEVPQQQSLEREEDPQYLGDREDDLMMRHIQKE